MQESEESRLHLLGAVRLEQANRTVKLPRRKAASLLAYLALHQGRHTRSELATLLWGDYLDDEARQSLRTALAALRRELGDGLLIVDNGTARLNPTFPLWVDAVSFETYAKRFLAEPPFDLSTSFLDLYAGDLLPGFYDDWIDAERDRLRSLYVEVLLHTAQQMRSHSDYARAIQIAQRVLAIEPANERAHQHLMFCHVTMGDRSAALRQYEVCQRALRADLDVAPMPETQALYRWIKGQPTHTGGKEARITNLPIPLTSFIGREHEMVAVKRALTQNRLVTLTGPGGSGKTRLAIQGATDLVGCFKDGVWFVDLAPVQDAKLVANAVALTIGAPSVENQPAGEALVAFLRSRRMLLLLDNCEHVIDACAHIVNSALSACPSVYVLATSREPLYVPGEVVLSVPPLATPAAHAIPASLGALSTHEATRLFVQRATMMYPDSALSDGDAPAVAAVCLQLDGMPLAIELAAARVAALSVGEIASHLQDRLRLLASGRRGAAPRHTSLRATIDWSYDLLTPDEQRLLRCLSLFAAACTLRAATAVYAGSGEAEVMDLLSRLVQKSLLVADQDGDERRYRLLETIKLYAWDRLVEAGEKDGAIERYIAFYCLWTEDLWDMVGATLRQHADGEHSNLSRAVDWCYTTADIARGVYLIDCLWASLYGWGEQTRMANWLHLIVAHEEKLSLSTRATAFALAGRLARYHTDFALGAELFQKGLQAARATGDKKLVRWAMLWLGNSTVHLGNYAQAAQIFTEIMQIDLEIGVSRNFMPEQGEELHHQPTELWLADALTRLGDYDRARPLWEEGLKRAMKNDSPYGVYLGTLGLGFLALRQGDINTAVERLKRALALSVEYGYAGRGRVFDELARAVALDGDAKRAAVLWGVTDAMWLTTLTPAAQRAAKREAQQVLRTPDWDMEYLPALAEARRVLGEHAFSQAYARGMAMSEEQAIAYALGDTGPPA